MSRAARKTCPECGVSVRLENYEAHLARVHPRDAAAHPLSPSEKAEVRRSRGPPRPAVPRRWLAIGALVAALAVVGSLVALTPASGGRIHLEPAVYDFGDIGQDVVSTSVRLHNAGASTLVVRGVSTSCMCTTARVVYGGTVSPIFDYHSNPAWSLSLPPDAEARLEVFYDPTVHPELGHYVRQVYVGSSDPERREAILEIHVREV